MGRFTRALLLVAPLGLTASIAACSSSTHELLRDIAPIAGTTFAVTYP